MPPYFPCFPSDGGGSDLWTTSALGATRICGILVDRGSESSGVILYGVQRYPAVRVEPEIRANREQFLLPLACAYLDVELKWGN